jgi:D-glycero-alpha-D-manno-heptose 1-phosphate guanylyltransferase
MIREAIVLAGGLGTRLQGVIHNIPKPMAPVNGRPFLDYVLAYLKQFQIERVILSVGYKYEVIEARYGANYNNMEVVYAVENEPLGTGGGIVNALTQAQGNDVFLLNGDTFFNVNLTELYRHHTQSEAQLTLSLKPMQYFDRYGTVELSGSRVSAFIEKRTMALGLINGGVYALSKSVFSAFSLPQKFSFEKDIMEAGLTKLNMQAIVSNGYFIDIGIPSDYSLAQTELPQQITV